MTYLIAALTLFGIVATCAALINLARAEEAEAEREEALKMLRGIWKSRGEVLFLKGEDADKIENQKAEDN